MRTIQSEFTAVIQRDGKWWVGWIEEVPGVNAQAHTLEELFEDLHAALNEGLEASLDREMARRAEEIKTGEAVGIPIAEVLAELRQKLPKQK